MAYILIVDDDPLMSDLYRIILESHKFSVRVANIPTQAIPIIDDECPALLALDIMMPGLDGLQILEKLRQRPEFDKLPIIMLSNYADEEYKTRALRNGANRYALKSDYMPEDFVKLVREVLAEQPSS